MNQQDKAFMTVFGAVLGGLVVLAVVIFIIAQLISGSSLPEQDQTERQLAQAEERIRPVGRVVVAGSDEAQAQPRTTATAGAEMSGEEVYNSACAACHAAGVLEAPVTGDNAAWSERYEGKGMQTLLDHAINGFNQMPARGGNADLSDRNVHDAIVFMLQQSEVDVAAADLPETDSAAADETAEPPTEVAAAADPAEQQADEAPDSEQAASAEPADSSEQTAATGESAEPEEGAAAAAGVTIPDDYDAAQGEETYNQVCMVCHAQGVAGAPKLGDQEAWGPRLTQGWETLQQHTLQGFNAMPAKGGRPDLPDEQILNSLAYMIEQSQ